MWSAVARLVERLDGELALRVELRVGATDADPGSVITWYHGLDLKSAAKRLCGSYPITSGALAKVAYQLT